jgi:hypothetical protein
VAEGRGTVTGFRKAATIGHEVEMIKKTQVLAVSAFSLLSIGALAQEPERYPFVDGREGDSPEKTQSYSIRCQENILQIESRIVTAADLKRTKSLKVLLDGKELSDEKLDMVRHAFFSDPVLLDVHLWCSEPNGFLVNIRYRWRVSNPRSDSPPAHYCTGVSLLVVPREGNRIEVRRVGNPRPAVPVDLIEGRVNMCF